MVRMVALRLPLAVVVVAILSAGCIAGAQTGSSPNVEPQEGQSEPSPQGGEPQAESGPTHAEPDPHGDVQRTDSDVTTFQDAQMIWHAVMTVTLVNGVAGFTGADVGASLATGAVALRGEDVGSYTATVGLEGMGATEDLAKEELSKLTVEHSDTVQDGKLVLSTTVKREPMVVVPMPTGGSIEIDSLGQWKANIDEVLPNFLSYSIAAGTASGSVAATGLAGASMDLHAASGSVEATALNADLISLSSASGSVSGAQLQGTEIHTGSSSGAIRLTEIRAGTLEADTASGSLELTDVRADMLDVHSSSGTVQVAGGVAPTLHAGSASGSLNLQGIFDNIEVGASSGSIHVVTSPEASGSYDFGAASGSVRLELGTGAGQAYDVEASTASGSVDIELSNSEEIDEGSDRVQHVRTVGFESAAIQTVVSLNTSSGSIHVAG